MKQDNTIRKILIVAAILFALAIASVAAVPFARGFWSSLGKAPLFRR